MLQTCVSFSNSCGTGLIYITYRMCTVQKIVIKINKLETKAMTTSLQYRQDVHHIAHYHKRKYFPSYTRCSENNTCTENRKIRGLKFDTLYQRHLAAYRKI